MFARFHFGRFFRSLAVVACIGSPVSASTLLNNGNEVFDSATSFAWLKMSFTNGLSPIQALTANAGYRYATQVEVYEMFLNGDITAVDNTYRASDLAAAQSLVSLFGTTFGTAPANYGFQGFAKSASSSTAFFDPFIQILGSEGKVYPGIPIATDTRRFDAVGVFLVREITPVPLPASGLLLGAGIILLAVARRSAKNRATRQKSV